MAKPKMGRAASKRQCIEAFKDLGPPVWNLIEKANNLPVVVWNSVSQSYVAPSRLGFLRQIDKVLEQFGTERMEVHDGLDVNYIWYVNTGESYGTTVMLYNEKFYIGSWGDVVEYSPESCFP